MNEIVKYHNDFSNQIILKKFTANELNFLMAICSKMRNQETNEVIFTFEKLKELVCWDNNNNKLFIESLKNTNKKLLALNFEIKENKKTIQFVLFPTFITDEENKTLKVRVNQDFKYLLNGLSSNFTRFELEHFTNLQSKYSKMLYKELMKFKRTGYMVFLVEDFRKKLDIPEWYRFSEIDKKVLTPAKKELSQIFKKFEVKKTKKGREITQIEFFFTPQKEKEEIEGKEVPITSPGSPIGEYWKSHFLGVKYTKKHQDVIKTLRKNQSEESIIHYLQEQWDFVKNNELIQDGPAYFSSLVLEGKAVSKDYETRNRRDDLNLEKEKEKAEDFMKHLFGEKEITEKNSFQPSLFSTRGKEEISPKEKDMSVVGEITLITEEEAEDFYQEYLKEYVVEDSKIQRKLFATKFLKKHGLKIE